MTDPVEQTSQRDPDPVQHTKMASFFAVEKTFSECPRGIFRVPLWGRRLSVVFCPGLNGASFVAMETSSSKSHFNVWVTVGPQGGVGGLGTEKRHFEIFFWAFDEQNIQWVSVGNISCAAVKS